MQFIDVTLILKSGMPVWPGEPGLELHRLHSIENGMGANVSAIRTGCHIGTHIDAPLHFIEGGTSIDALDLNLFLGEATVFPMTVERCIDRDDLVPLDIQSGQRILFKTANSDLWENDTFQTDFIYITESAATYLVEMGVRTVGIDYLSVERFGLDHAPTHKILLGAGVGVIEGLDLREVNGGKYELICLPLKLAGADGSPARVILRVIE